MINSLGKQEVQQARLAVHAKVLPLFHDVVWERELWSGQYVRRLGTNSMGLHDVRLPKNNRILVESAKDNKKG